MSVNGFTEPSSSTEIQSNPTATESGGVISAAPVITNAPETDADEKSETELEKYWKAVQENPSDFTGWTYLLQYVEQENDIDTATTAFESFLARYPYCYGYWKKYADLVKKHGFEDKTIEIFRKGLKAIPLSIDLWNHYIQFYTAKFATHDDRVDMVRNLYLEALETVGKDFRSDKLWQGYIQWEQENGALLQITSAYDRVLAIPVQLYSYHMEGFTKHVRSNLPKSILSTDEFLKIRTEVVKKSAPGDVQPGEDGDKAPGEGDEPPGLSESAPEPKLDDAETIALQDKIIEHRQQVHKKNEEEVSKRWTFEEGIRRPYFHVKPLEKSQLKNWREYLEFEIGAGQHDRVVFLFERCLIACALYEEFWIKYSRYMEKHSHEEVRNIYKRACNIHLTKKPNLYLTWAAFEERNGNFDEALSVLHKLEEVMPGLAVTPIRIISMQRRRGNFTDVETLFQKYIEEAKSLELSSFFSIKYARFLSKSQGNLEKSKAVLQTAIEKDPTNSKLHLQLIDMVYHQPTLSEATVLPLFDRVLSSDLRTEHKVEFAQRKLEFLEDFSIDVNKITEAYDQHQALERDLVTERKRRITEVPADSAELEPAAKKAHFDSSLQNGTADPSQAAAAAAATDPNYAAYSQWSQYQNYAYPQTAATTAAAWGSYSGYYGTQQY